jgi:hypothetical protein
VIDRFTGLRSTRISDPCEHANPFFHRSQETASGLNYNERKGCERRAFMTDDIRLKQGVMAEEIRVVEHYSASILNKVGEGARILGVLRDAGVNLIAFWGYKHGPGRAQLEFIPEDSAIFVAAAKQARLRLRKRTVVFVHGDDRPGAIADMLAKLAGANIDVAALQAVCGEGGRYGAIVFLPPAAAGKAASVLAAS